MYGLPLQAICEYLCSRYGEDRWAQIRSHAGISQPSFDTREIYAESLFHSIARSGSDVIEVGCQDLMESFGVHFVNFLGRYGYDTMLKVLGRNMRDFLNGLDNLHEYLRHSYPHIQAPSFFCDNENRHGLTLHYWSRRQGYIFYVMGQLRQVGVLFYNTQVEIEIIRHEQTDNQVHVMMNLYFDNRGYEDHATRSIRNHYAGTNMPPGLFFRMFPFHIAFSRNMAIMSAGSSLRQVLPEISEVGCRVDHVFDIAKPPIIFTFEQILDHTNNIFQLTSCSSLKKELSADALSLGASAGQQAPELPLKLKGQMRYMSTWDAFLYLATPIVENVEGLFDLGLYINDLSMHDASREMVLVGTEHSTELKSALTKARHKSRKLEAIVRLLDVEISRTDDLLYQMIPKEIADRLRGGEPAINTCQVVEQVSVLFCQVLGFGDMCRRMLPMQVVTMLNVVYSKFDKLTEIHHVFKVETTGNAYMVVGGAPRLTPHHALLICDMALDMVLCSKALPHPEQQQTSVGLEIRIGVHSGTVVAGVVGLKTPRYCLFGDTVNTASRMENHGQSMQIHISEETGSLLDGYPYALEQRGAIDIKGKGLMKTFWLISRTGRPCVPSPGPTTLGSAASPRTSRRSTPSAFSSSAPDDYTFGKSRSYTPVSFDPINKSQLTLNGCSSTMEAAMIGTSSARLDGARHQIRNRKANSQDPTPDNLIPEADDRHQGAGCILNMSRRSKMCLVV